MILMMSDRQLSSSQDYLLTKQYKNDQNLRARIQLHEQFSTNKYDWQRWVFDHFVMPEQARLLELGCGPGELWVKNLDRIPGGWDITLSDLSPGMLHEAQKNLQDSQHHFSFAIIDAQSIPFSDNHFDAVIANHMLYHIPDRAKALSEIRRVLKEGGHFYAATNGQDHMRELRELLLRFDPDITTPWSLFSPGSLSFWLENGQEELSPYFSHVTLHRYHDGLEVTGAEPLIAYVLSTPIIDYFDEDKLSQFRKFIQQEIQTQSAIHISKETGLFEAY